MKRIVSIVSIAVLTLIFVAPLWAESGDRVLQPESSETPQCAEKCLTACQSHCKLECVYECKCPKDSPAEEPCWAECITPCSNRCQNKECLTERCETQCRPKTAEAEKAQSS